MAHGYVTSDTILAYCEHKMKEMFALCIKNAPNFGVSFESFKTALQNTSEKYLFPSNQKHTKEEVLTFLDKIYTDDLFMALACANGSESAWGKFDQQYRSYLERVARQLTETEINTETVVDTVYVELYGTRIVNGERFSKFADYSGIVSLRSWLQEIVFEEAKSLDLIKSPDQIYNFIPLPSSEGMYRLVQGSEGMYRLGIPRIIIAS